MRHKLNETLRNGAGHIGYGISLIIVKGYATQGLALVLQEAKIGIDEALLSVNKNLGSLKAQQKWGCDLSWRWERILYENQTDVKRRIPKERDLNVLYQ